jgi:hypothetical protein
MKTEKKKIRPRLKRRSKSSSDAPLIERKNASRDGELSREDFEILGDVNLANDLGDDEQLKYWEDLGKNSPTSEMEDYELNVDYELQMDDDDE